MAAYPENTATTIIDSPLGNIFLEASEKGITRCALSGSTNHPKKARARKSQSATANKHLARATKALDKYFTGSLDALDSLSIDIGGTIFQRKVWHALRKVRAGSTKTYGQIAKQIRHEGASRAVGTACGANPIGIIVPCHRVIASNGKLGGYNGGLSKKSRLLQHEASA